MAQASVVVRVCVCVCVCMCVCVCVCVTVHGGEKEDALCKVHVSQGVYQLLHLAHDVELGRRDHDGAKGEHWGCMEEEERGWGGGWLYLLEEEDGGEDEDGVDGIACGQEPGHCSCSFNGGTQMMRWLGNHKIRVGWWPCKRERWMHEMEPRRCE